MLSAMEYNSIECRSFHLCDIHTSYRELACKRVKGSCGSTKALIVRHTPRTFNRTARNLEEYGYLE